MALSPNYRGWLRGTTDAVNAVARGKNRVMFGDNTAVLTEGANPDAFLMGHGTSSSRASVATSGNFLSFYTETSATSGDTRGMYLRTYWSGAAGGGEAARIFGTVNNVAAGTARGAHISLSYGTSGTVSGLGAALETTLHMPSGGGMAGTNYSIKVAINADAAGSDPAGATTIAFVGVVAQGTQAGIDDLEDDGVFMDFQGFTADNDASHFLSSVSLAELPAGTVGVRCKVGSTLYYLPLVAASAWN